MLARISIAITSCITLGVLIFSWFGLEVSDEGFYLNSIAKPNDYTLSFSQFGFLYHPIFNLLRGSIGGLRTINALIIFSAAFALSLLVVRLSSKPSRESTTEEYALAGALAIPAFGYLSLSGHWLATPSYNSLTLLALLLAASGLILSNSPRSASSIWPGVVLGLAGGLLFLAKPSSAALLAPIAACYLLIVQPRWARTTAIASLASLLFLAAMSIFIDGSALKFADRLQGGVQLIALQGSGHTAAGSILRMLRLPTGPRAMAVSALLCAAILIAWRSRNERILRGLVLSAWAGAFAVAGIAHATGLGANYSRAALVQLAMALVPLGILLLLLLYNRAAHFRSINRNLVATAGLFFVLPFIYSFGTNNDTLVQASSAAVFWTLAAAVVVISITEPIHGLSPRDSYALLTQAAALLVLFGAVREPYRQRAPLYTMDTWAEVGSAHSRLLLHSDDARFLSSVQLAFQSAGAPFGTRVIDLTGVSPGILFATGAQSTGAPWLVGGYPGSDDAAVAALRSTSCAAISVAWVLADTGEDSRIDEMVLGDSGLSLRSDFRPAANWRNPLPPSHSTTDQVLYRPILPLDAANRRCETARAEVHIHDPEPRNGASPNLPTPTPGATSE